MKSVLKLVAALGLCAAASIPALADPGTKVALVPGGPHPYFAAWEQAGKDAMKDFNLGAGDYRVPQKWELAQQSQLLESLLTQGYNSFLIFPGDAVGTNAVVQEITENGGQAIATAAGPFGRFTQPMREQADQLAIVSRFVFSRDNALHALGQEGAR